LSIKELASIFNRQLWICFHFNCGSQTASLQIAFDRGRPAQTNQISPADASVPASRRRRESAGSGDRVQSLNHSPCARTSPKWKRAERFAQSARQNNALSGKSESKAHWAENRESYRQLTYRFTSNILLEARRVSIAVGVRTWLGNRELAVLRCPKQLRARFPRGA
jgi:hypothetical protein